MWADVKIEKIKHGAQTNAVDEVAERSPDNHAEPDLQRADFFLVQPPQKRRDNNRRYQAQNNRAGCTGIVKH